MPSPFELRALGTLCETSFPAQHRVARGRDGEISWGQLMADVGRLRVAWRDALEVEPAAGCALFLPDCYDFAVALFALLAEGRQVLLPGEGSASVASALRARGALLAGEFDAAACLPIAARGEGGGEESFSLGGELVVFTSGSSGEPKAIAKQLGQLDAEVAALEANFGALAGAGATVLGTVSHQHFYGLLFRFLWPLLSGRPLWRTAFLDNMALARRSAELSAACWVMGPGHLHRLEPALPWSALRGRVNAVFSAGGPLRWAPAVTLREELGQAPIEILGSSETGAVAWRQRGAEADRWQALAPVALARSERGALQVRSPFLADDAWFETEDQVEFADDGSFCLGGRLDRIAKLGGKRIALPEVESALLGSPWIGEAHCLPLAGESDRIGALLVLSAAGRDRLTASHQAEFIRALRAQLAAALPPLAIPRRWRILPYLPFNAQGKLPPQRVAAMFRGPRAPAVLALQREGERLVLALWVDRSCPYFAGHFPAGAVLPGVTQVMWAELLAREYLGLAGSFGGMQQLKFKEIVRPDTQLQLELQLDRQGEAELRLGFRYSSPAGEHSQGRLVFRDA